MDILLQFGLFVGAVGCLLIVAVAVILLCFFWMEWRLETDRQNYRTTTADHQLQIM